MREAVGSAAAPLRIYLVDSPATTYDHRAAMSTLIPMGRSEKEKAEAVRKAAFECGVSGR
jgi:hypothetical protein